ncbi:hypothetical protein ParKJ_34570 [Paraburkholderia fungorum]|jgi:hypothetical protein|uniref:Uncharacterized protein n=1 Tax=Paraburkholderia fungorum TaxID=134537 RepID=A0AAP5V024_9BURK|nr:hypothetical protein [Paraburkholderia fungorum]MDT8842562.1 hypothetical protein [Paraburkholderia fungorum]
MSRVIPFTRLRVTKDERIDRPLECAHHHIRLDPRGGLVNCRECGATLTPFWALSMLADQYAIALAQIQRLNERLAGADSRILELSTELDATRDAERTGKDSPPRP